MNKHQQLTFIAGHRPGQNENSRVGVGGVGILIVTSRFKSIRAVQLSSISHGICWCELIYEQQTFYIASVYIPPHNSHSVTQEQSNKSIDQLCDDIMLLSQKGLVILGGDFNQRIGQTPSIINDQLYIRSSIDSNDNDRELVSTLDACNTFILNGLFGQQAQWTNILAPRSTSITLPSSIVDYFCIHISALELFDKQYGVNVKHDTQWSPDHALLTIQLHIQSHVSSSASRFHHRPHRTQRANRIIFNCDHNTQAYINGVQSALASIIHDRVISYKKFIDIVYAQLNDHFVSKLVSSSSTSALMQHPMSKQLQQLKSTAVQLNNRIKSNVNQVDHELVKQYKKLRLIIKKQQKREHDDWHASMMSHLSSLYNPESAIAIREYWSLLKQMAGWSTTTQTISMQQVITKSGDLLQGKQNVFDVWHKTFQYDWSTDALLQFHTERHRISAQVSSMHNDEDHDHVLNQPFTIDEVAFAVKSTNNHKSSGPDNIPSEAFSIPIKFCDDLNSSHMLQCLHNIFNTCFSMESTPSEWSHSYIMPLFKQGDKRDPLNWRPISLINSIAKIYSCLIYNRLNTFCNVNNKLSQQQFGFRNHLSIDEPLFIFNQLLEQHVIDNRHQLFVCCIDSTKAYDMLWRDGLWYHLHNIGIVGKMWRVIKNLYNNTSASVIINGILTESFLIDKGVKQGDVLSPLLFNIYTDPLSSFIHLHYHSSSHCCIGDVQLTHLMYADDLLLFATSADDLQLLLNVVQDYFSKWLMTINYKKTKITIFDRQSKRYNETISSVTFNVHKHTLSIADSFTYLGVLFTRDINFTLHQSNRINLASQRLSRLNWMRRKGIFMNVKHSIEAYEMLVQSIIESSAHVCLYGRKLWQSAIILQHQAACQMLDAYRTTTRVALRGELGWISPSERMNQKHLQYWGKLMSMSDDSLTKCVLLARDRSNNSFPSYIDNLINKYQLKGKANQSLQNDISYSQWSSIVVKCVHQQAETEWKDAIKLHSKLRTYCIIKHNLQLESYLLHDDISPQMNKTRAWLTQLRTGSNMLCIDRARSICHLESDQRICPACQQYIIPAEDETHFILHCNEYSEYRRQLFESTFCITDNLINLSTAEDDMQLQYMLGNISNLAHPNSSIQSKQIELIKVFIGNCITARRRMNRQFTFESSDNDEIDSEASTEIDEIEV